MKKVPATHKGKTFFILVDDEDFERFRDRKWRVETTGNRLYAIFREKVLIHRAVMGLTEGDGLIVDHINGNGLDNRRKNLRLATGAENAANHRRRKKAKSGFIGVTKNPNGSKWSARVGNSHGNCLILGPFDSAEEAARVRDNAALERYGAFARLNFPTETGRKKK